MEEKINYYNEKFPIIRDMIHVLYDYCPAGGCCHIVTDDNNIYNEDLEFVINYAQREENRDRIDSELSIAICKMLIKMTFLQRAVLFDSMNYDIDYRDKEDFDIFYPSDEDSLKNIFESYDWDDRLDLLSVFEERKD